MGVFAQIRERLASEAAVPKTVVLDATHLKAHRVATGLRSKKGGSGDQPVRLIGRTKGSMNTKQHAVTDADGRPIRFFVTACQVSNCKGATVLLGSLLKAEWLLADRGYDADWLNEAFKDKWIKLCIPGRKSRGESIEHDKRRYKRRNRNEIMFDRLRDWRRVATRDDRCPKVFLSAVALATTDMFRL